MRRKMLVYGTLLVVGGGLFMLYGARERNSPLPAEDRFFAVMVNGLERRYLAHVPSRRENGKQTLVIVLHGGGGPAGTAKTMMEVTGWGDKADAEGFVAVFPEGTPRDPAAPIQLKGNIQEWNDGSGLSALEERGVDDVAFIGAVMDDAIVRFGIDARRIFVTGFSNGASMTFRTGVELADRIAAIAPVAGALWIQQPMLTSPVSLLHIAGSEDSLPKGGETNIGEGKVVTIRPPVQDRFARWAELLHCASGPEVTRDGDGVKIIRYGDCADESEVVTYTVYGMGHVYPDGRTTLWESGVDNPANNILNATDAVWDFFKKHSKVGR